MRRFLKWQIGFQASKAKRIRSQKDRIVAKATNFGRGIPRFGFFWWYWFPWIKVNVGIAIYWLCFVVAVNAIPVSWIPTTAADSGERSKR